MRLRGCASDAGQCAGPQRSPQPLPRMDRTWRMSIVQSSWITPKASIPGMSSHGWHVQSSWIPACGKLLLDVFLDFAMHRGALLWRSCFLLGVSCRRKGRRDRHGRWADIGNAVQASYSDNEAGPELGVHGVVEKALHPLQLPLPPHLSFAHAVNNNTTRPYPCTAPWGNL